MLKLTRRALFRLALLGGLATAHSPLSAFELTDYTPETYETFKATGKPFWKSVV